MSDDAILGTGLMVVVMVLRGRRRAPRGAATTQQLSDRAQGLIAFAASKAHLLVADEAKRFKNLSADAFGPFRR